MVGREYSLAPERDSGYARARLALLGIWIGAMLAFGGLFVPAAFEHLPTQLAAAVLADGFTALDRGGAVAGTLCVALGLAAVRAGRRPSRADLWRALAPAVGVLAHAANALAVVPRLHAVRIAAGGAIGQLPAGDPELAEFAHLHAASRALFALATASALLACAWDVLARRSAAPARAFRDAENIPDRSDFPKNP